MSMSYDSHLGEELVQSSIPTPREVFNSVSQEAVGVRENSFAAAQTILVSFFQTDSSTCAVSREH